MKFSRRFRGGHWERWTFPDEVRLWLRLPSCTVGSGTRPLDECRGTPECEHQGRAALPVHLLCLLRGHRSFVDLLGPIPGGAVPPVVAVVRDLNRPVRRYCHRCNTDLPGDVPELGDRIFGLEGPWRG